MVTLTSREKFILLAALSYLDANRDDANTALDTLGDRSDDYMEIEVNGTRGPALGSEEVALLLFRVEDAAPDNPPVSVEDDDGSPD